MQRLQVTYEGTSSSVPRARHEVEQALETWGLHELTWTAALLVSELASNALLHARTGFTVVLEAPPGGRLRLEVSDGSRAVPRARRYGDEATTGRGLRLVEDLSDAWGVHRTEDGKTVWVELVPSGRPVQVLAHDEDDADAADALLLDYPDLDDGPVWSRAS